MKSTFFLIALLFITNTCIAEVTAKEDYKIINDILEESKITVLVPNETNNKLLLLAHGLRMGDAPLASVISHKSKFHQELLKEGWIIASTSYRRNGLILHDAIDDIENLRKYIETEYGKQNEIYIKGSSMGGKIITLIAEQKTSPYTAVMGIGSALHITEEGNPDDLTFSPQIPILFLSNQSETKSPENYMKSFKSGKIKPVLWIVDRDGHCNTNSEEELLVFRALLEFTKGNEIENNKHILFDSSQRESTAKFEDGKAFAKVMSVSQTYGNLMAEFCQNDLIKLGIEKDTFFEIGFKNKVYKIFWGTTYSDVNYGLWVAFITSEGYLKIARNFKNAVNLLKCSVDDEIYILKRDNQTIPKSNAKADSLGNLAWGELLQNNPAEAEKYTLEALKISPDTKWLTMNLAHCYLLGGKVEEAKKIFTANKGQKILDGSFYFEDFVIEDIEYFRKEKIENEYFDEIIELMK
jgi:hypothetical protein